MPDDASSTAAANGSQAAVAPSESGDVVLAPDGMVAPQQKGAWAAFIKSVRSAAVRAVPRLGAVLTRCKSGDLAGT